MWVRRIGISLEEYFEKISQGLKRCTRCKQWKPIKEFAKDSSRKDGLHTKCRQCHARPLPHKSHIPPLSVIARLSERMKGNQYMKGKSLSLEHRWLLRNLRIEEGKNGITQDLVFRSYPTLPIWIILTIKRSCNAEYHQWRKAVFERDHYICQKCGDNKGGNLEVHHIKSWTIHKELRYNINNGITICRTCHALIHDKPDSYRKRRKQKRLLKN